MSIGFSSNRSKVRSLLFLVVGAFLLVAALDIVSFHKLSEAPATGDDGLLTSKGQTERRADLIWGSIFTAVGGSLVVVGGIGLASGQPMVELTGDAMRLRVAGPMSMMDIAWSDIVSVRSDRDYEGDARIPIPVLMVEVHDAAQYPDALWGSVWEGNVLKVDADGWQVPVEDVVVRAEIVLDSRSARSEPLSPPGVVEE